MGKLAVFSSCDKGYFRASIVALSSVKKYNPECDLFLLIKKESLTEEDVDLLKKHNIKIPKFDSNTPFKKVNKWPEEAYWCFYGPKIFYKMGYEYSIFIDPDVLCVSKFDVDKIFSDIVGIGGVNDWNTLYKDFKKSRNYYLETFDLKKSDLKWGQVNGGVLYYRNRYIVEKKIWEKSIELFEKIGKNREALEELLADQGMLSLLLVLDRDIKIKKLDKIHNYLLCSSTIPLEYFIKREDIIFAHFIIPKPWKGLDECVVKKRPMALFYMDIWNEYLDESEDFNRDLSLKKEKNIEIERLKKEGLEIEGVRTNFLFRIKLCGLSLKKYIKIILMSKKRSAKYYNAIRGM